MPGQGYHVGHRAMSTIEQCQNEDSQGKAE